MLEIRRALRLTTLALCALASDAAAQRGPPPMSPAARAYLETALDTMRATMLGRDTLPWGLIRDSAFVLAAGAQKPSDAYGAIDWALRRANKHSFLQAGTPGAVAELLRGRLGYVRVPQRGGRAQALADSLHEGVARLEAAGACGWIVDLRGNGGGNMWPMLVGIGPLLGDSLVGSFGGAGTDRWFYLEGISGTIGATGARDTLSQVTVPVARLRTPHAPLAVLFDRGTGSSGEAVAVAFRGRPASRSFGEPTAGFATANRGARLQDGANLVLTGGYYTDRRGMQQGERLEPDTTIAGASPGWPFPTDRVASAAADWLERQPTCRGGRGTVRRDGHW